MIFLVIGYSSAVMAFLVVPSFPNSFFLKYLYPILTLTKNFYIISWL